MPNLQSNVLVQSSESWCKTGVQNSPLLGLLATTLVCDASGCHCAVIVRRRHLLGRLIRQTCIGLKDPGDGSRALIQDTRKAFSFEVRLSVGSFSEQMTVFFSTSLCVQKGRNRDRVTRAFRIEMYDYGLCEGRKVYLLFSGDVLTVGHRICVSLVVLGIVTLTTSYALFSGMRKKTF